ncbi:MAG: peptidase [Limisphaerales bacterium]
MAAIDKTFEEVFARAPRFRDEIAKSREILLANLAMTGEIPAPTFKENLRGRFLMDRFRECGLDHVSQDEVDNTCAVLTGSDGEPNILLAAHLDTLFPESVDHTLTVDTETVRGAGVADNSLGVAFLATLPNLLEKLDLQLKSNLILAGVTRGIGRGNIEGMNFFLDHYDRPLTAGVCVEGVELGRLSFSSLDMLRAEITCVIDDDDDLQEIGASGAVGILSDIIDHIARIPIPQKPKTKIILGSCTAGKGYNIVARTASLRLEVQSEEVGLVSSIEEQLKEIVAEVESVSGAKVAMETIARREPGGLGFSDPLTVASRRIMDTLEIEPEIEPSTSELSALIAHDVPGVTLGITKRVDTVDDSSECVEIEPMAAGMAQLITLLVAIDGGLLDG